MSEFDNNTLVNMMTAIDLGCRHLSGNFDTVQIERALVMRSSAKPSAIQAMIGWLKRCIKRA
jgi:hypothetical protein